MIRWVELGAASMPGGGGDLRLMQRGTEFSIMAGPTELMNSRLSGSEEALARLTAEALGDLRSPRWLIGGLGMGFTLRAALALLPAEASVTVAELVPEVAAWARGPLTPVFGDCLDDPRVDLRVQDVAAVIAAAPATYDAILLDVDNGPEGLTRGGNDRLYDRSGLGAAHRALTPGGVLAVWSSAPSDRFTQRLHEAGFEARAHAVRASTKGRGARHTIWIARAPI